MSDADRTRGQIHPIRGGNDHSAPPEGPVRRLAAILAADISGYSRLMGLDEEGTYARVMRQRRELLEPTIAEHHGKLINYAGDGFLAMFDSPVETVRCAIVIQQSMVGRNTSLPREQWILYRIGVHLGDDNSRDVIVKKATVPFEDTAVYHHRVDIRGRRRLHNGRLDIGKGRHVASVRIRMMSARLPGVSEPVT
jgi:class 3 adenylate cyclase